MADKIPENLGSLRQRLFNPPPDGLTFSPTEFDQQWIWISNVWWIRGESVTPPARKFAKTAWNSHHCDAGIYFIRYFDSSGTFLRVELQRAKKTQERMHQLAADGDGNIHTHDLGFMDMRGCCRGLKLIAEELTRRFNNVAAALYYVREGPHSHRYREAGGQHLTEGVVRSFLDADTAVPLKKGKARLLVEAGELVSEPIVAVPRRTLFNRDHAKDARRAPAKPFFTPHSADAIDTPDTTVPSYYYALRAPTLTPLVPTRAQLDEDPARDFAPAPDSLRVALIGPPDEELSTMAAPSAPKVDHTFFPHDQKLLTATVEKRTELRKAIAALQQALHKIEGSPVQVTAEVRFKIAGATPKEHVYTVSVTGPSFDPDDFARSRPTPANGALSSSPAVVARPQENTFATPRSGSRPAPDDDVIEVRSFKKPRLGNDEVVFAPSRPRDPGTPLAGRQDDLLAIIKEWRTEWKGQGGWLFDTLTKAHAHATSNNAFIDKKLDAVQDVLGQSINSANSSAMTELANITKLLPWVEHCRKTSADKVQAREEKWRSSSANFHDQNRREREAAEKQIETKLDHQQKLLVKLAKLNGLDTKDEEDSREQSLGAQLTAELNLEANRVSENGSRPGEAISIDDD